MWWRTDKTLGEHPRLASHAERQLVQGKLRAVPIGSSVRCQNIVSENSGAQGRRL